MKGRKWGQMMPGSRWLVCGDGTQKGRRGCEDRRYVRSDECLGKRNFVTREGEENRWPHPRGPIKYDLESITEVQREKNQKKEKNVGKKPEVKSKDDGLSNHSE